MSQATESQKLDAKASEKLLKGIRIPPQPQILADLHLEMAMPDFTLNDVAGVISKDVALSGYIVKAVNSPFFGLRNKVSSIAQAVSLLGLDSLLNIINAISLRKALSDSETETLADFWDNAKGVAEVSAFISRKLGLSDPDELYALGLFHNSGIPLLLNKHADYLDIATRAYSVTDRPVTDVENAEIQSNHSVVGYYVAKSWKLPDRFCMAIAQHHKVDQVLADENEDMEKKNLLAILKLAGHLCGTARTMGAAEDHEFTRIGDGILRHLGLTDIDVADLRDDLINNGIYVQ